MPFQLRLTLLRTGDFLLYSNEDTLRSGNISDQKSSSFLMVTTADHHPFQVPDLKGS